MAATNPLEFYLTFGKHDSSQTYERYF